MFDISLAHRNKLHRFIVEVNDIGGKMMRRIDVDAGIVPVLNRIVAVYMKISGGQTKNTADVAFSAERYL